ncbi:MAG TPA: hypothetical protein DDW76_25430 [Cyanobacteria bacterium UBA11369]|nr:hypothetical protein [Cyanobacteria bacterium UBA11371]HBE36043.1 hypothetical protein [Cyanobacteria bacterium UBA11368]HBE52020.1 hypothetical protein [Cyanobacteria bacterium UBA11369]
MSNENLKSRTLLTNERYHHCCQYQEPTRYFEAMRDRVRDYSGLQMIEVQPNTNSCVRAPLRVPANKAIPHTAAICYICEQMFWWKAICA